LNTTFNIRTDNFDYNNAQRFIEIAPQQVSIFVLDANNCFNNFSSYSLTNEVNQQRVELNKIFNGPLLNNSYKETTVIYTLPQSILTPAAMLDESQTGNMLSLVFGPGNKDVNRIDFIAKYDIYNVYRIPVGINKIVTEKFPSCKHYHQFSVLPDCKGMNIRILCIFYNNGLSISLHKDQNLIFTNYFTFSVPEDISYYILSICNNFDIDVQNVHLILAGLIEKDSILYKEMYKYFLEISFLKSSDNYTCTEGFEDYPPHYFNHLFEIAACV
jgi:hypothetical protein